MIKKIKWLLLLAIIIVAVFRFSGMEYYYNVCGWMANYRPRVYIPMYTCIYLESYGGSTWQVVTWLDAVGQ